MKSIIKLAIYAYAANKLFIISLKSLLNQSYSLYHSYILVIIF